MPKVSYLEENSYACDLSLGHSRPAHYRRRRLLANAHALKPAPFANGPSGGIGGPFAFLFGQLAAEKEKLVRWYPKLIGGRGSRWIIWRIGRRYARVLLRRGR